MYHSFLRSRSLPVTLALLVAAAAASCSKSDNTAAATQDIQYAISNVSTLR